MEQGYCFSSFPSQFYGCNNKDPPKKSSLHARSFSAEASDNVTAACGGMEEGERWDGSGDVDELWEGGKASLAKPQELPSGEIRLV